MRSAVRLLAPLAALLLASGCATVGPADDRDPIEGLNRAIFSFNEGVDDVLLKPLASGYKAIAPQPVDKGVTNFFGNMQDVVTTVNDLLQLKIDKALSDAGRVAINTTLGILGLFDFATDMGLEKRKEDFGQTLGYWGVGNGPYLVLPILGSSTLRDAVGIWVDVNFDPLLNLDRTHIADVRTRNALIALKTVDARADLLSASRVLEEAALDKYDFIKEGYFQTREDSIHDGKTPKP